MPPEHPILPSQYLARSNVEAFQPERRLMAAVLAVALAEHEKYAAATDVWGRRRFIAVETWFASDNTSWPFSFLAICEALGLEVSCIRAALRSGHSE